MSDSNPLQRTQYLIGKLLEEIVPGGSRIKAPAGISEGRSDMNDLGPRGISKNMEGRNGLRPRILPMFVQMVPHFFYIHGHSKTVQACILGPSGDNEADYLISKMFRRATPKIWPSPS